MSNLPVGLSRWRDSGAIVIVCLLCYVNALDGAFHYDDFHSIVDNPSIRSLANAPAFFWDTSLFSVDDEKGMYRPMLLLTYAINYAIGGYGISGYQTVNLLLHLLCSLFVWKIAAALLKCPNLALMSGLIFAVHPVATEPVNYVSSRSELLAGMFYLGAFLTHITTPSARFSARRLTALALFACGLLSKSMVVTLPLVLIVYDLGPGQRVRNLVEAFAVLRARWPLHLPYWLLVVTYLCLVKSVGYTERAFGSLVRSWMVQLWTQLKAPVYYAKLLVVPVGQNVEHQFFESHSVVAGAVALGTLFAFSLLIIAWLSRREVVGFCLGWSVIALLPTLVMPLNVLVNERRLYLVIAGAAWIGGDLLRRQRGRLILAAIPIFTLLTIARNDVWADEVTLWRDAVAKAPAMYRNQTNLGKALQVAGEDKVALAAYERAMAIDSRHGDVYNNIATLLHRQGNAEDAIEWYRLALDRYPDYEEIHQNLADAYSEIGLLDSAAALYARAVQIDESNGAIWANYGQTLYRSGNLMAAEKALRRSIEILPTQGEAYNNLGNVYADRGELEQALTYYELAINLDVACLGDVLSNIGDVYRELGELEHARKSYTRAVEENPSRPGHYQRLGAVEAALGYGSKAEEALRRALRLQPSYWKAHTVLAELLVDQGRLEEAAVHFRAAVDGDSGYGRAWYGLARMLDEAGRDREAIAAFERFLQVWPHRDDRYTEVIEKLSQ